MLRSLKASGYEAIITANWIRAIAFTGFVELYGQQKGTTFAFRGVPNSFYQSLVSILSQCVNSQRVEFCIEL